MDKKARAGDNEKKFNNLLKCKIPEIELMGKKRYQNKDGVKISVDQSFSIDNVLYLVEVDSGNMAKLLVGQYILLNLLCSENKENVFFLIVHAYKNYNPERTVKNLNLVNSQLYSDSGIKFGAIHINKLDRLQGNSIHNFLDIVTFPTKKTT